MITERSNYRYELSIERYRPNYYDGNVALQHDVVSAESVLPISLAGGSKFDIAEAKFWTKKIDEHRYPEHLRDFREVSGKVCIYRGTFVDTAVEISSRSTMAALIVTQPPQELPAMPVFCLSKGVVEQIISWGDEAKIIIKPEQASPSGDVVDKKSPAQESTQEAVGSHGTTRKTYSEVAKEATKEAFAPSSGNSKVDTATLKDLPQSGGRVSSSEAVGTRENRNMARSEDEEEDSDEAEILADADEDDFGATAGGARPRTIKRKGFLASMASALGITYDNKRFSDGAGWMAGEKYQSYREAMSDLCDMQPTSATEQSVVKKMPEFLNNTGGNILIKLAFACKLWTVVTCPGREELLQNIIKIIGSFDFGKTKPDIDKLQREFIVEDQKPNLVFYEFFREIVEHNNFLQTHKDNARLWANTLWLWLKCGLLKSPIDYKSWSLLGSASGRGFSRECKDHLIEVLRRVRYNTMVLFLQPTLQKAYPLFDKLAGIKLLKVEAAVGELLDAYCQQIVNADERDGAEQWRMLLEMLSRCSFVNQKDAVFRQRVLASFMSKLSFISTGTFAKYHSFMGGLALLRDQHRTQLVRSSQSSLRQSVRRDIDSRKPSALDVGTLLRYAWCSDHLKDEMTLNSIFLCSQYFFSSRHNAVNENLLFLDSLREFVGEKCLVASPVFATMKDTLGRLSRREVLDQTCKALEASGSLFKDASKDFSARVASLIVGSKLDEKVFSDISITGGAVVKAESYSSNDFARCFAQDLTKILAAACDSMLSAALIFLGLCKGEGDLQLSLRLASRLFCESFSSWYPKSLDDALLKIPARGWELVFDCFALAEQNINTPEILQPMTTCMEQLKTTFTVWFTDFQSSKLALSALDSGLELSKGEAWTIVADRFKLRLPRARDIEDMIKEIESLIDAIMLALVAPEEWGRSLQEILVAYECRAEHDRPLAELFAAYAEFVWAQPGQWNRRCIREGVLHHRPINLMRSDKAKAEEFHSACSAPLGACAYFLRNPSFLFQEKFLRLAQGGLNGVHELSKIMQQTSQEISSLCDQDASFGDVKRAVLVLESRDIDVREELAALAGCEFLELEKARLEHFLFSSLICRIYEPISDFLGFCEQSNFALQRDDNFLGIRQVLDEILGQEKANDSQGQCSRLRGHLCPDGEQLSVSSILALEGFLPVLRLFSCFRRHYEVWSLAEEKKWFGKEGIRKFLGELDHLSNMNLDMDAYSTTILEVMEPTIRIISNVGGLKMEATVSEFFSLLLANQHTQQWLEGGRYRDFAQVQQHLGQLRRWFCDEENEITRYYRDLQAITSTGRFSVNFGDTKEKPGLRLGYQHKDSEEFVCMKKKDIQSLLEQLNNIQHDDQRIAGAVDSFRELLSIVEDAACAALEIHGVGYQSSTVLSFSCGAGKDHVDDAIVLRTKWINQLRKCRIWLQDTRRRYPHSLLFWQHELREMYSLIFEEGATSTALIVHSLSRLLPPSHAPDDMGTLATTVASIVPRLRPARTESWLLKVSGFIEEVQRALNRICISVEPVREVMVHSVTCDAIAKEETILGVLQSIYKVRGRVLWL